MKAKRMKDNKEQNINEEEYKYGAYERKLERAEYKIKKKNKGLKIFLRVLIVIIVIILGIAIAGYSFVHSKLSKMKTEYIDEKTKEVKLLSVYRDTYVYVTENGNKKLDKITHAYSYGGAQNTLKSLNEALDLNITEYVTVNFDAVIAAVNALNGVEIDITSEELKYINDYIDATSQSSGVKSSHLSKAGRQTVDGVQAVAYSRIRYTAGGDYKRTERMRTVVTAMAKKAKTLNIGQLNKLADEILPRVSKNIENNDIIALIPSALSFDITESLGWPYNVKGISTTAWYGVPVTLESNVIRLHKELFGQEDYKVSETVKEMNDAIIKKTGYIE